MSRFIPSINVFLLLSILLTLLPYSLASPSSPLITNTTTPHEKRQMSQGTSCAGSEGQWNCLTTQWQRCASGQWSSVMDCAAGTMCTPSGLTYDFAVQFANGAAGSNPPATSGAQLGVQVTYWTIFIALGVAGAISSIVA
ncbi:uncharacterized protein F4822DRAFT_39087 [Hypoxylon trugodes]|uniref:uncharacterized protein n=1 Tax=Hypoxylon trugodes TaxID=326681 RepID=UPI00218F79EA|nr:uncharacterized protein F4822DRAFT_39087 [Hypoxylon trugodes]KAI1394161.1 hypothetical protein F4822DRAFT_39087 [Hypoxylon trugodes]